MKVPIKVGYNRESDTVVFEYAGVAVFVLPFEFLKKAFEGLEKQKNDSGKSVIELPQQEVDIKH
jgi:DUF971 family protein